MYVNQTIEFKDEMTAVETECEIDFDGSELFKHISLLVFFKLSN